MKNKRVEEVKIALIDLESEMQILHKNELELD